MATRLKNIKTDEISLVDRAAVRDPSNPKQPMKFLFWKKESGADPTGNVVDNTKEVNKVAIQEGVLNVLSKQLPAELDAKVTEALNKAGITDEATLDILKSAATLVYSQKDKIEKARTNLSLYVDNLIDDELAQILSAIIGLGKSEGKNSEGKNSEGKNDDKVDSVGKGDGKAVEKKDATIKAQDTDQNVDQGNVTKDAATATASDAKVDVTADPKIMAALEKAEKDNIALAARLAKAEEMLAKAEDAKLTAEFVAKADSFGVLGVNKDEFGAVLKDIFKAAPEAYAKLETFLNTFKEIAQKSEILTKEFGRNSTGASNDALSRLQAAASELKKSDSKLTDEQAFAKAMEENPELYQEYVRENYGGGA